jgi:hypothetical protein
MKMAGRDPTSSTAATRKLREIALNTLLASTQIWVQRGILSLLPNPPAADEKRRTIFDAKNSEPDPRQGTRIRGEEDPPVVAPHLMDSASMRMSAFLRRTG